MCESHVYRSQSCNAVSAKLSSEVLVSYTSPNVSFMRIQGWASHVDFTATRCYARCRFKTIMSMLATDVCTGWAAHDSTSSLWCIKAADHGLPCRSRNTLSRHCRSQTLHLTEGHAHLLYRRCLRTGMQLCTTAPSKRTTHR